MHVRPASDSRGPFVALVLAPVMALMAWGCTPVTEVPFVLEDLAGTYRVPGVYGTLHAVNGTELCDGTACVSQVRVGDFVETGSGGAQAQCTLYVGGVSLELRANGNFFLEGTRRQECQGPHLAGVVITREALSTVGLYRLSGDGIGLIVLQSAGTGGTFRLEGRVEGVASVTSNGQLLPQYVHFGVRDRSGTEFTTTWTR